MLRVLLYRAWVWPNKCTVAAFFQRVHNISFFLACKQYTTHSIYVKNGTIQRVASPAHVTLSAPLSFPTSKCNSRQGGMKLQKKKHHRKFPERCAPSKRCEACKKLTQVLCKKTKNPQKNLTVRPENGERLLQLTKETWSLEEKKKKKRNNKAVTVPKKEQTTKQFLLVHTCSQKVQGIFAAYQQDNFTTTDDFKCTRLQALPKRSRKTTRSVPWTVLQPTIFFFVALGNAKPRSTIHLLSQ